MVLLLNANTNTVDIVVVVFKEGNTPFDPRCIKSQFNRILHNLISSFIYPLQF